MTRATDEAAAGDKRVASAEVPDHTAKRARAPAPPPADQCEDTAYTDDEDAGDQGQGQAASHAQHQVSAVPSTPVLEEGRITFLYKPKVWPACICCRKGGCE
jgi:hypothetical protein